MAGVGNDIDQRGLVVLLGNGSIGHALSDQMPSVRRPQRKAHGQTDTLTGNGPLQEHGFPVQRTVTGDNLVGQVVGRFIPVALIGHPGHLRKDLLADIGDQGRDTSHIAHPPWIKNIIVNVSRFR